MGKTWKQFARRHTKIENKYVPLIEKAMRKQVKPFFDYAKQNGLVAASQNLDGLVTFAPILKVLQDMISEGAMSEAGFAFTTLKQLHEKRLTYGYNEAWTRIIQAYLGNTNVLNTASGITQTTKRNILTILQRATDEGLGIDEIEKLLDETNIGPNRARLIARTELTGAMNFGSMMGAVSTGVQYEKEWITAGDHRVRGLKPNDRFNHVMLDGVKVEMNEGFNNGELLAFPGMKGASAGNVCNCRCTVGYVPKRNADGAIMTYPSMQPYQRASPLTEILVQTIMAQIGFNLF